MALAASQIRNSFKRAFTLRPAAASERLASLRYPAMWQALRDTHQVGIDAAAKQVNFMLGRNDITSEDIVTLRCELPPVAPAAPAVAPAAVTATLTAERHTISEKDDESALALWHESRERAQRMHRLWRYQYDFIAERMDTGMPIGEKHLRLVALLSDSAGAAARSAAQLFEANAVHNSASVNLPGGAPPASLHEGRIHVIEAAVEQFTSEPEQSLTGSAKLLPVWDPPL